MTKLDVMLLLTDYTQHTNECVLSYWSQGRPIKDVGYECMYKGKWYQTYPIDNTPKCECGLQEVLDTLKQWDTLRG